MTPTRRDLLKQVAGRLLSRHMGHPLRVGIDGVCGAGKSTFASDLADALKGGPRPVVRLDSDGFHHVRAVRHRQTYDTARGYYEDAYDFGALVTRVLQPLGPGGNRIHAVRVHDLRTDRVIEDEIATAPTNAVVLFDATFLQRDELRTWWDEVIYLHANEAVALERGIRRDGPKLGGTEAARIAHESRYMAACRIYLAEQHPRERATMVVDNTDPDEPRLL